MPHTDMVMSAKHAGKYNLKCSAKRDFCIQNEFQSPPPKKKKKKTSVLVKVPHPPDLEQYNIYYKQATGMINVQHADKTKKISPVSHGNWLL